MVTAASDGPLLHSFGRTAGKSESTPGMGVGWEATTLHGGWVGAGEGIFVGGATVAVSAMGAQALSKNTKIKRRKRFFFMGKKSVTTEMSAT